MPSQHAGKQFTMRFDAEQEALLTRLGKKYGGKKEAVLAGLKLLEGKGDRSKTDLLAEIERRLK